MYSYRSNQGPMNYMPAQVIAADTFGPSLIMHEDCIRAASFQIDANIGGGTTAAVITVEASNDPRARPGHDDYDDAVWEPAVYTLTAVTTGAQQDMNAIAAISYGYIRLKFDVSAGTGTQQVWFCGYGEG